jgi:ABC-type dipeptide/oligopeptide/nickel transport system ATPase component
LDGKILKQPYVGPASSETRLIGTEIKYRDYDIVKYQDQMFYHNKNIRLGCFSNPVSGEKPLWPPELLNDYDSTFEIYVIIQLLKRMRKKINSKNIAKISRDITMSLNEGLKIQEWKTLSSMRKATNKKYKENKNTL